MMDLTGLHGLSLTASRLLLFSDPQRSYGNVFVRRDVGMWPRIFKAAIEPRQYERIGECVQEFCRQFKFAGRRVIVVIVLDICEEI